MKTFSVAVAVAVVLAFICIQESSAFPFTGVQELEEPMDHDMNENPLTVHHEIPVELEKMPLNNRQKRELNCIPYCYPTGDGIFCGVRCDFCC